MKPTALRRILDANFNRSREGLRVAEEVARFFMNDRSLTAQLKRARHGVTQLLESLPHAYTELLACRESVGDVGRGTSRSERRRASAASLFLANTERAKESLRVLEECLKFVDAGAAGRAKQIRFTVYAIEKRAIKGLEALRSDR